MGKLLIVAAYAVYAAFWIRLYMHILVWWKAAGQAPGPAPSGRERMRAFALAAGDVLVLGRLFKANPLLWFGEWLFHASFLLVVLRHLRYFLDPVPSLVWYAQEPGLIAGFLLPLSLVYILVIRLFTKQEKYTSAANLVLLGLVLVISSIGLLMNTFFTPDLVAVKLFIFGLEHCAPGAFPGSILFGLHFVLFLALVLILPTHIVTAPLVMMEARKREQALHRVIHDGNHG